MSSARQCLSRGDPSTSGTRCTTLSGWIREFVWLVTNSRSCFVASNLTLELSVGEECTNDGCVERRQSQIIQFSAFDCLPVIVFP